MQKLITLFNPLQQNAKLVIPVSYQLPRYPLSSFSEPFQNPTSEEHRSIPVIHRNLPNFQVSFPLESTTGTHHPPPTKPGPSQKSTQPATQPAGPCTKTPPSPAHTPPPLLSSKHTSSNDYASSSCSSCSHYDSSASHSHASPSYAPPPSSPRPYASTP